MTHHVTPRRRRRRVPAEISTCFYFPEGTIHVAVVDPGVGTTERPLLVSSRYHFLGPDNRILTYVCEEEHGIEVQQSKTGNTAWTQTAPRLMVVTSSHPRYLAD
ncbi:MAG: SAM-dependent chlorinase/fluorinase [Nitrospira sp.]|nr:SAM-dependent chlorinase/fluorinase [Nitrospira sp.]